MFIDEAIITVIAGDGGNGCFAYLREKFKPKGRPSGGNGGRGGHIYVEGSSQLHTLEDLAYRKTYRAANGAHGSGANKYGKDGKDLTILLPLGTMVYDADTGELLLDCVEEGKPVIVAKGGRGGRGNAALVSKHNRNPDHAEHGKAGERRQLRLELKVLADVGLVGRPNAGKSTFLTTVSHARPKIADYPFTTTRPFLGIVSFPNRHESFVMADIPGLIEGSYLGKGLGIRFLRHIERTKVLAIMVEATAENPRRVAKELLYELSQYSPLLASKPKIFILSKSDLIEPGRKVDIPSSWYQMSAVTRSGVDTVLKKLKEMLEAEASRQ